MFRDQVYNTVGKDRGQLSTGSDTFRRLTRRIHHNMGLLNTSRSSNHSSSFRMRRTELSGERYNSSRDKDQTSNHISGLNSQEVNQSRGQVYQKISTGIDLNRRRFKQLATRPKPNYQSGTKNIVQNLYMLASNQKQQQYDRQRSKRTPNLDHHSPRTHNNFGPQQDRRRQSNSRQRNQHHSGSNSRESRLGQRQRLKDQSKLRNNKNSSSRDRKYNPNGEKIYQDIMIKRLQEKYLQNVYELKSPRGRKDQKKRSEKEIKEVKQMQAYEYNIKNKNSNTSTKNMNTYYFQPTQATQVSSSSGGTTAVKTLPQTSKFDGISQASLPVNSVNSQKDIASKGSISPRVHQKNSVKLDRVKQKHKKQSEKKVEQSRISLRWKMNNVQLQERKEEKVKKKEKVIEERQDQVLLVGSVFLPVQSKRQEGREWAEDILERIILHLECLNIIADYTKQFRKMYENTEQWQILIFLAYKKFYIQRNKVGLILKASVKKQVQQSKLMISSQNPFLLPYSKITQEQLVRFRGSRQCLAIRQQLQSQDTKIRNALRGLYNLYIQKSGEHVNMLDCDNFSQEIYRLMLEQLDGIAENLQDAQLVEPTKLRMGKIIKSGLLIAYLNGKYVKNFAQILLHEDTVKIGKRQTLRQDSIADLFLQQFKRVLS